jgi:hypothetical protein
LILVGDREDLGRDIKIKGGQLTEDAWKLLKVDVTCRIMKDTGHEFNAPQMNIVGRWLREEPIDGPEKDAVRPTNATPESQGKTQTDRDILNPDTKSSTRPNDIPKERASELLLGNRKT